MNTTTTEVETRTDARVAIVELDKETSATMTICEEKQSMVSRDGKVPWNTAILAELRGKTLSVAMLHFSIEQAYGKGIVSRMRCYKYLNGLVSEGIATVEFNAWRGENVYTVN